MCSMHLCCHSVFRAKYGAIVVTAHVQLSSFYMDKKIPYRYFVRYPTGAVYFEYIHDMPVSCNRCLELNYQTKGKYYWKTTYL